MLARRVLVRAPGAAEALAHVLQHQAHGRADLAQFPYLRAGHRAGIEVRPEGGLAEHQGGHLAQVGEGAPVAAPREPRAGFREPLLGPFAQGEQRLPAPQPLARFRDGEHLFRGQVQVWIGAGVRSKGAVAADIAAQPRQRDEHLGREGDRSPFAPIAQRAGGGADGADVLVRTRDKESSLIARESTAAQRPLQCRRHGRGVGDADGVEARIRKR